LKYLLTPARAIRCYSFSELFGGFARAGSNILKGKAIIEQQLLNVLGFRGTWQSCYDASVHGWSATTFHSRCNNKGATVTVALSTGNRIFGGYFDGSWKSRQGYAYAKQPFLYRSELSEKYRGT
jgi:hypothetical protein